MRAEGREQRAESKGQRAKGKGQRAAFARRGPGIAIESRPASWKPQVASREATPTYNSAGPQPSDSERASRDHRSRQSPLRMFDHQSRVYSCSVYRGRTAGQASRRHHDRAHVAGCTDLCCACRHGRSRGPGPRRTDTFCLRLTESQLVEGGIRRRSPLRRLVPVPRAVADQSWILGHTYRRPASQPFASLESTTRERTFRPVRR